MRRRIPLQSMFVWTAWIALLLFVLLQCRISFFWSGGTDDFGPSFHFEFSTANRPVVVLGNSVTRI